MDGQVCYHGREYTAPRRILRRAAYQLNVGNVLIFGWDNLKYCLLLSVAVWLSACSSTPAPQLPTKGTAVNLSGAWEVDFKRTENAQEKLLFLYEIASSQIRQEQRRRDNTQDSLMNRQVVQQAIDDLNGLIKLGTLADSMNRSTVLRVEQGTDYIVIKRDDDFSLTCELGVDAPSLAFGQEWCGFDKNGQLIFISRLPEGLDIVHRFMLSANGEQLSVATSVKTPALSDAYTINRVYMPFEEGSSLYNCEFTLEKKKTCSLGPAEE